MVAEPAGFSLHYKPRHALLRRNGLSAQEACSGSWVDAHPSNEDGISVWVCSRGCGFEGTIHAVNAHEFAELCIRRDEDIAPEGDGSSDSDSDGYGEDSD